MALSQLTAGARLRKEAEYWKQEYIKADLAHDRQIYQSMHRLAVGKIAARSGVPLRRISVAACALIPAVLLLTGATQYLVFHQEAGAWILFSVGTFGGITGFFIVIGEYSVLNFARRDVLVSFLDGKQLLSDFNVWPDRRRAFQVLGGRGVLEVLLVSISACAVVVAVTVSLATLSNEGASIPSWVTPVSYLAYPSVIYLIFAIAGASNFKRSDVWLHPRPLTAAAGVASQEPPAQENQKSD